MRKIKEYLHYSKYELINNIIVLVCKNTQTVVERNTTGYMTHP